MLDGRDIKLIDIIDAHPDIDPVDLAERFSVSDRSVRTYVRKTNEVLGSCAQIEKRRGGGYSLRVLNASAFAALRARDVHVGQDAVPTTPEARVDYLLNDLLSRADWITVDDLANILFVSRNVVTNDLKQVAATLDRFRPRFGEAPPLRHPRDGSGDVAPSVSGEPDPRRHNRHWGVCLA